MIFTSEDLHKRYENMTGYAIADCVLLTRCVGGVPSDDEGLARFVRYQYKLDPVKDEEEIKYRVSRIKKEELGKQEDLEKLAKIIGPVSADDKDTWDAEPLKPPEPGDKPDERELVEKAVYGVNQMRRSPHGPWLGNWMAHACLKVAASRIELFTRVKGSKGDMTEMGSVKSRSISMNGDPTMLHLVAADAEVPTSTFWETFRGKVSNPRGSMSIIHDCECAPPGTRFSFMFRWYDNNLTESMIGDVFSAANNVGLGSAKSFGCGKWDCTHLEVISDTKYNRDRVPKKVKAAAK